MPRLNQAGKDIRRVLEWLLNRDVPDTEIGSILGLSKATYSRRKDADDFPNFAELTAIGEALELSPRVLQIAFGWRGEDELVLLNWEEVTQYLDQVGWVVGRVIASQNWEGDGPFAEGIRAILKAVTDNKPITDLPPATPRHHKTHAANVESITAATGHRPGSSKTASA